MEDYLTEWTIDQKTYNLALAFASEQADLEKGQRVFYNTLAVWAVNHLLGWMEFETILDKNKSRKNSRLPVRLRKLKIVCHALDAV